MSNRIFNSIAPALLLSLSSLHVAAAPAAAFPDQAAAKAAPPKPDDPDSEDDALPPASAAAAATAAKPIEPVAPTSPAAESPKTPAAATSGHTECKHLTGDSNGWKVGVCGYVALNAMHDSTQGLGAGLNNSMIARPGTYAGDHDQMQFTARDSRINVEAAAPTTHGIETTGLIQMDFTGIMPSDTTESDSYIFGTPRLRIAMMRLRTPVVDLIAGQYHDLFGWGGSGFFPATLGFLGVPGEIYHRNPQFRVSKTLHSDAADFEIAVAAVRPFQKAAGVPDGEGGLRLAFNKWTGASTQAYNQPSIAPAAIGVSGVARRFKPADFVARPADPTVGYGWGFAANAVIPVIPRSDNEDRSNGLTLTAEFSTGSGISDLYTNLTGGLLFPTLANDQGLTPPALYNNNIDPGVLAFDGNGNLKTANWRAIVLGLQYYLPIGGGRVWLTGVYSQSKSTNITVLTPIPDRGTVFFKSVYVDGSLFVAVTDAVQLSGSFQTVRQLFGDNSSARNNRLEFGAHFFF
jgi:hypothetical protein